LLGEEMTAEDKKALVEALKQHKEGKSIPSKRNEQRRQ
jgi:hypothetical protein